MELLSNKSTWCMRCGKEGKQSLCDACYDLHQSIILEMECPTCSSGEVSYNQQDDSWKCGDCANEWRDEFYFPCPLCYNNLYYIGDLGKYKCRGCNTLFDQENVLVANQEVR